MRTYVFRCANLQSFLDQMAAAGLVFAADDHGVRMERAGEFEFCPVLETAEPSLVFTVRVTEAEEALIPGPSPTFLIDYDPDCEEWPMYVLADGSMCGAGIIA